MKQKIILFCVLFLSTLLSFSQGVLSEGFENATFPPTDWQTINNNNDGREWSRTTSSAAHTGSYGVQLAYSAAGVQQDDYLVLPMLAPTADSNSVSFWAKKSSGTERIEVVLATSGNGGSASDFTVTLMPSTDLTASWVQYTCDLSAYAGQYVYVAVHAISPGDQYWIYVDDVYANCLYVPTCPAPTNVLVDAASTSANITWTEPGSATSWQFEYGANGFTQGTGTMTLCTDDSITLSGLTPITQYQCYVRGICGVGDTSLWTGPISFMTSQTAFVVPFYCDFENATDNATWQFFNNSNLLYPNSWTISDAAPKDGLKSLYITKDAGTTNSYQTTSACVVWACKDVYFTPANEYELGFDWRAMGQTNVDYMAVYIGTTNATVAGQTSTSFTAPGTVVQNPLRGAQYFNSYAADGTAPDSASWIRYAAPLDNSYAGKTKRIFFAWINNATNGTQPPAAIDNFFVKAKTCGTPKSLAAANVSGTSADLTWQRATTETDFEIAYSTQAGFNPDTVAATILVSDTNYTLTGLSPLTTYYVRVRALCSDTSCWNATVCTFTTGQIPFNAPGTIDFEDASENAYWGIANNSSASYPNGWYIDTAADNGGLKGLYISNNSGLSNAYSTNSCVVWAYRDIYFSQNGDYTLEFDWKCKGATTSDYAVVFMGTPAAVTATYGYYVSVSTPTGASSFTNPLKEGLTYPYYFNGYNYSTSQYDFYTANVWNHATIQLTGNYYGTTQRLYFAWKNSAYTGYQPPMAIDNITISANSCLAVDSVALDAAQTTDSSVVLTWHARGAESSWILEYKLATDTAWTAVNVNAKPYTLQGLTGASQYQVRIKADCGGGSESEWSSVLSFYTACGTIKTFPWNYGFEDEWTTENVLQHTAPRCWNNLDRANTSYYWQRATTASYVHSGNACAQFYSYSGTTSAYAHRDFLITPLISLTGNEQLRFYARNYGNSYAPTIGIKVVPSQSDTTGWYVGHFTVTSTTYQEYVVDLSAFSNYDYAIAFVRTDTGEYHLYLDDIVVEAKPACVKPSSLATTTVGATSANLTWTAGAGTSDFEIALSTDAAFNPDTASHITVTGHTSDSLTGLNACTTYYAYVRANCGTDGYSDWSSLLTFTTNQIPATLPYSCDFENATESANWQVANNSNASYPNGWYVGSATNNGGSNSLYISNDYGVSNSYTTSSASCVVWAYRDIDFSQTANSYVLSFDWKSYGESNWDYMRAYIGPITEVSASTSSSITDPAGATALKNPLTNSNYFQVQNVWNTCSITLDSSYANTTKRLYFVWKNDGSSGTPPPAAIDNISVTAVVCDAVTDLDTTAVTSSTIALSWTAGGTETNWQVEYCIHGTGAWQTTTVTGSPVCTLTSLTAATSYDIRVKALCGGGDESPYTSTVTVLTSCGVISSFPWSYGFEDTWTTADYHTAPGCWNNLDYSNTSYYWQRYTYGAHTGSACAYFYSYNGTSYIHKDYLITPEIQFTGNEQVVFYAKNYSSSYTPKLVVGMMTADNDTTTFVPVQTFVLTNSTYNEFTVDLSAYTGNYYLAFARLDTGNYYIYLDDITIEAIPTCVKPTALTATNVSGTYATIAWNTTNVSPLGYEIAYSTSANFNPDTCSNSIVTGDVTSYTLPGGTLRPLTTYYVYVRAICSAGDTSVWNSNVLTFTTGQIPFNAPGTIDFEDASENSNWGIANNSSTYYPNGWYIDTAADNGGLKGLYISNNSGVSNVYSTNSCVVWAYRDLYFSQNGDYTLEFDWKCKGATSSDYAVVFMGTPAAVTATYGYYVSMSTPAGASSFTNPLKEGLTYPYYFNGYNYSTSQYDFYTANVWNHATIQLTGNYYGTTQRLYFAWENTAYTGYQPPMAIDNIVLTANTCLAVDSVACNTALTTDTSVVLTWHARGTESSWILEYKLADDTAWSSVNVAAVPFTLTGLAHSSDYDFRVKADCGGGDESSYAYGTFRTACGVVTSLPWQYDFPASWTTKGNRSVPTECWNNIDNNSSYYWYYNSYNGINGDGCAYYYGPTSTATQNDAWLIMPTFTLTGNEQVSFFAKRYSASYAPEISVYVLTDATDTTAGVLVNTFVPSSTNYEEFAADLSAFTGDYAIALVRKDKGHYGCYVDNISVEPIPACIKASNLTATNVSGTFATLNWTAGDTNVAGYEIALGTDADFDPNSSLLTFTCGDTTSYTLPANSLQPTTTYYAYVRTLCGSDTSIWNNFVCSFTTSQIPFTVPFTCTFEDSVENSYWQFSNNTDTDYPNNWYIGTGVNHGGSNALYVSDDNGVSYHYDNSASCVVWAYKDIYFTPAGEYVLSFDWKCYGESTYDYAHVFIGDIATVSASTYNTVTTPTGATTLLNTLSTNTNYFNGYDGSDYNNTGWNVFTENLQGVTYSGTTKRLYFAWRNDGSMGTPPPMAIDNISVVPVTCVKPYNLVAYPTMNSAVLAWTPSSGETDFEVVISTDPNFIADTCQTSYTVNDTFVTINGLATSTLYYFAIRSLCGENTESDWTNKASFSTTQDPFVAPGTIDFEDTTENVQWSFVNNSNASYPNRWYVGSAVNNGGSNALYVTQDNGVNNTYANKACRVWAYRDVAFPANGDFELTFDWKCYGESNYDYMAVFIGTPAAVTATTSNYFTAPAGADTLRNVLRPSAFYKFNAYDDNTISYSNTGWNTATLRLPITIAGTTQRLYFAWFNDASTTNQGPAAVDNIDLAVNTCMAVADVHVPDSAISTTSATVDWTERGSATTWIVEYKETASLTWDTVTVTTHPYSLTGLNASSSYQIRVKADCGGGEESFYSDVVTFNTLCDVITTIPWSYNFEDTWEDLTPLDAPRCWNNISASTSYYWTRHASNGIGGSGCAHFSCSSYSTNNGWLITPEISFTGNEQLSYFVRNYSSYYTPVLSIYVLTDPTDTTTATFLTRDTISSPNYTEYIVDLSAYNDVRAIAFVREDAGEYYTYIDNIRVEAIPSCAKPMSVAVTGVGDSYATISWNCSADNATGYEIAVGTSADFDPDSAALTFTAGDTNAYTLPSGSLSPSTTYYFYVRTICGSDDESVWNSTAGSFSTSQVAAVVPFVIDFEDSVECGNWQFFADGETHEWIINQDVYHSPSHSLYVTDDGYTYESNIDMDYETVWAYRDVVFPAGYSQFTLSFAWKCESATEEDYYYDDSEPIDYMNVFIGDPVAIDENTSYYSGPDGAVQLGGDFNEQDTWTTYTHTLGATYAGTTKRLYFMWHNPGSWYGDYTAGDPAAVDDISITPVVSCDAPTLIQVSSITATTANVAWSGGSGVYNIEYGPAGFEQGTGTTVHVEGNSYVLTGLEPQTQYYLYVQSDCSDSMTTATSSWLPYAFTTDTNGVSIREQSDWMNVSLQPNPAQHLLNVTSSERFESLEILNLLGEVVYRQTVNDLRCTLNVSQYPAGVYFVKLYSTEKMITRKFVKE